MRKGSPSEGDADMRAAAEIRRIQTGNEVIYAIGCGEGACALVDVGSRPQFAAKVEELQKAGIALKDVAAVFITHFHEDHCGAISRLREQSSARVVAHRLSVEKLPHCIAVTPIPKELVDYTVDEGDTVELGDLALQVHHLPGHTPDSTAWQLGQDFFVGDITFDWGGVGWMDVHWGSCVADYRASLQQLFRLRPAMLYPGHGNPVAMSRELLDKALASLNTLAEAHGSPLDHIGHPAPRRRSDDRAKIIRLSTSTGVR
jgi:glyoxylase-like metal-dependent hydrolase (beta-lactamase superfamily II)